MHLRCGVTGECSRSAGEDLCQMISKVLEMVGEDRYFTKKIVERKFEFAGHILRGSSGRLMSRVLGGLKENVGRQRSNVAGRHKEMERRKKI